MPKHVQGRNKRAIPINDSSDESIALCRDLHTNCETSFAQAARYESKANSHSVGPAFVLEAYGQGLSALATILPVSPPLSTSCAGEMHFGGKRVHECQRAATKMQDEQCTQMPTHSVGLALASCAYSQGTGLGQRPFSVFPPLSTSCAGKMPFGGKRVLERQRVLVLP